MYPNEDLQLGACAHLLQIKVSYYVHSREILTIHGRQGFVAVLWFWLLPHPLSPVSKLDRRRTGRLRKKDKLLAGEWVK
jgi:hypothetical protein